LKLRSPAKIPASFLFDCFGELNDLILILKNTLQRPAIFWWMENDGLGDVDGGVMI
jgi:hypothetical protein